MNGATSEHHETAARWPRRFALFALGVVVCSLVVTVLLWWLWLTPTNRRLAGIVARGEPTTFAELDACDLLAPPEHDAAEPLRHATTALAGLVNVTDNWLRLWVADLDEPPPLDEPWPALEPARLLVKEREKALRWLHEAAELGGRATFPALASPNGVELSYRRAAAHRWTAGLLRLETHVLARAGDFSSAARSLRARFVLAETLGKEPVMIAHLFRTAMFDAAVRDLLTLLCAADFVDADLLRIQETLATIDFAAGLKQALIGSRVYGIAIFDDPAAYGVTDWRVTWSAPVRAADEELYLDLMAQCVAAAERSWPVITVTIDSLRARTIAPLQVITQRELDGVLAMADWFVQSEVLRRLAIVAIALERYRRSEGLPAADLAALVPEHLPVELPDPTSGLPFRYGASRSAYEVYSPSGRFLLRSNRGLDLRTGANPGLLFRWPSPSAEVSVSARSPEASDSGYDEAEAR